MTDLEKVDRYLALRQRARAVVQGMHPGLAAGCDLESLEATIAAFERVSLKGDRVTVASAQKVAAEAKAAADIGNPITAPEAGNPATAAAAGPVSVSAPSQEGEKIDKPAAPVKLVVKQKPPVAKKGRKRGFALPKEPPEGACG